MSTPRRVLIVTQYFWPEIGAPQVRYAAMTRALLGLGLRVDVLTGVPNYPGGRIHDGYSPWRPTVETHDGVRIHRLPHFAYGGHSKWLRLLNHGALATTAIGAVAMDLRPDIVMVESPPLPLVVPAAAIARRHGAPLVLYCADLWPAAPIALGALRAGFLADRLAGLESFAYRASWRIAVPTEGLRAKLLAHPQAGASKVMLLPNGVDTEVFRLAEEPELAAERATLGAIGRRTVFTYAGTLGPVHALDTILDAAALLRDDDRVGIVIVGDGPDRERLQARAGQQGLANVVFVGAVPPAQLARYLALSRATIAALRDLDLFVSARSAQVLPALACGRPVIFSGRGESAAMIERERCGIVVPPEEPRPLAASIARLSEDADTARAMGERGRAFAVREYDFDRLVRRWWTELSAAFDAREGRIAPD